MRFGPKDKFWVVTDPTPRSEIGDILFEASLAGLLLRIEDNPTIFTEREEAEAEAKRRLDHELDEQRRGLAKLVLRETAKGVDAELVRLGIRIIDDDGLDLRTFLEMLPEEYRRELLLCDSCREKLKAKGDDEPANDDR